MIMQSEDSIYREVCRLGLINDTTCGSIDIFNEDYFVRRIQSLLEAFNYDFFIHAMALKANPIRAVMNVAFNQGMGAECASISEVIHAISLGLCKKKIIFDSPCKTKNDLKLALLHGIVINLDNETEVEIVNKLIRSDLQNSKSKIGLRINPVTGEGSIDILSTATKASKFGLALTPHTRSKIIKLYQENDWLQGVHVHVGSQGMPLNYLITGVKTICDLVVEIESVCGRDLNYIDIGGGLSTSYKNNEEPPEFSYQQYHSHLKSVVPKLFSGKWYVITEFGRSLLLKAGKTLTRVAHVKDWMSSYDVNPILQTYVGTNQFIREAYLPQIWDHHFSLLTSNGTKKLSEKSDTIYDIAGPLCFQGDFLGRNVCLPKALRGDIIVVHDTGAYAMSMYSLYNSIVPSAVYGYCRSETEVGVYKIRCFKEVETPEQTLAFWGSKEPRVIL